MDTINVMALVLLLTLLLSNVVFLYAAYVLFKRVKKLEKTVQDIYQQDYNFNSTAADIGAALKYIVTAINDIQKILSALSTYKNTDGKHITIN